MLGSEAPFCGLRFSLCLGAAGEKTGSSAFGLVAFVKAEEKMVVSVVAAVAMVVVVVSVVVVAVVVPAVVAVVAVMVVVFVLVVVAVVAVAVGAVLLSGGEGERRRW